jgi:septal ring factor EnvC (AmiA/AmiB activator)
VRRRYSTRSRFALSRRWLGRGLRTWGGVVAVAVACSLLATSARAAAPAAMARDGATGWLLHADSPTPLDQLEAQAAELSKKYRGQLEVLSGAKADAEAAETRVRALDRQLGAEHRRLARLATASYEGSAPDQALAFFAGGDPQQVLGRSATIDYLAQQRDARDEQLHRLMVAGESARQAAQAKVAELQRMVASLAGQQDRVKHLLAQFRPQSPTIGDSITPRMREVRDEVDRRFGPFSAIGCYRPGSDGEHPLGRACDFMLSTGGVMPAAASVQKGYDIAAWAQANASRLGIMYIIYRQRIWDVRMPSSGWVPMENRGSITANHYDHVHISVF